MWVIASKYHLTNEKISAIIMSDWSYHYTFARSLTNMNISPFSTIDKNLLSEKIAAQVLLLIKERQLKPGEKLPPERELAAMLKVSRTALREAFRALAVIGAIDSRQGNGTFVTSLNPEMIFERMDHIVSLSDSTFENLFEARRVLEVGIIMDAARRITDCEITELEQIIQKMETLDQDNYATFLVMDIEFHESIIKAAQNPIFQSPYLMNIRRFGRVSRIINEPVIGLKEQSFVDHREILNALKTRNPDLARLKMEEHLNHIAALLKTVPSKITLLFPTD